MIIKLYTRNDELIIIENITDVRISNKMQEYSPNKPTLIGPYKESFYDGSLNSTSDNETYAVREIRFVKDGVGNSLYISNFAYVCNDDGKTIEKVSC